METSAVRSLAKASGVATAGWRTRIPVLYPWLLGIAVIAYWQVSASAGWHIVSLFSSPTEMLKSGMQQIVKASYWGDVAHSAQIFAIGLSVAVVTGIVMGLLIAWWVALKDLLDPLFMLVYTLPREAIIPLLIIWFGIGRYTEIVVAMIGAFFPVLFNTVVGVHGVDPNLIRAARAFNGTSWDVFRSVLLPGSFPAIMTGIRLGIGRAVMGVVVAEMYMGIAGLGSLIVKSQAGFNVDRMLFNTLVVSTIGFLAVQGAKWLERRVGYWREEVTG